MDEVNMVLYLFHKLRFSFIISTRIRPSSRAKLLILFCLAMSFFNCRHSSEPLGNDVDTTGILEGIVTDAQGPVSGATVRIQTTDLVTTSGDSGRFILTGLAPGNPVTLTAWAPGYYIGGGREFIPDSSGIELHLEHHAIEDNPAYEWISAFSLAGNEGNCQNCHAQPENSNSHLPFDEWQHDAHASAAQNPRFVTMYSGTDIYGNQSPPTRYGYNRDYGTFPLRPDPTKPYYGPGYKLDFPGTVGNCAACHTPAAAINAPYGVNPTEVAGVGAEGIGCDFCHKVWDVQLNPATGLPYENMPGVLSLEFRRPPEGHQFFSGPLDDIAPGEDVYTPIQKQSQYCASCHFASFWGTIIYNSFGEWLDSPYSTPGTGQTCQDCHMPPGLTDHFARLDKGGIERNPATIFSHRMPGALDENLLRNAVSMTADAELQRDILLVEVEIINDRTGHHVPTDSPLRHMILLVQATDEVGNSLVQVSGPTLPDWCGLGDSQQGYYGGLPGTAYAKILEEMWTGISPTGAYWNMTRIISDNRLPAFGSDKTTYTFAAPASGIVTISIRLIFRRAFIELMDWKSWDTPDIIMEEQTLFIGEDQ